MGSSRQQVRVQVATVMAAHRPVAIGPAGKHIIPVLVVREAVMAQQGSDHKSGVQQR